MNATHIDLYQLTSLVPHWDQGLADQRVTMSFFSRRLPRSPGTKEPVRGFLLYAGLRRALAFLKTARFDADRIGTLLAHPMLGPSLRARPDLVERLRRWRFEGQAWAPREGTPLVAGRAVRVDGTPVDVDSVRPSAQCPYLVVECDMLTAKLIETPLLSVFNHMTMVASKAARVCLAAGDRGVLEFGQRRTHPIAAVDAAYAAWLAGCVGTSNVEAHHTWGVPMLGTMDHFAIQAWERDGVPRHESERAFFAAFSAAYPDNSWLLVDTYDTYGDQTGIRNAVRATGGALTGIRLDSNLSVESIRQARRILDEMGATQARIAVSGGIDEYQVRALADAPVDVFGVGERIVTSPDAPVGVGAVGKLCQVGARPTMKLSRGSGKATLPGRVQVWRQVDGSDLVGVHDEDQPGTPLLTQVWDQGPVLTTTPAQDRDHARAQLAAWPTDPMTPRQPTVRITDALFHRIESLVSQA